MNNEVVIEQTIKRSFGVSNVFYSLKKYLSKLFFLAVFVAIAIGWKNKEFSNITPESGIGYWLGIIGGVLMLLLLLYPLRKKARFIKFGKTQYWFKTHMLFGVLGPLAILYHANFSLGSTNSNLAFFSMVVVALSGFVGRYFYTKIHHGLYGRKKSLKEMREALKISKGHLGDNFSFSKTVAKKIKLSERMLLRNRSFIIAMLLWPFIHFRVRLLKKSIRKEIRISFMKKAKEKGWSKKIAYSFYNDANNEVQPYINRLYRMYGFRMFNNLFSLWHVVHLPFFTALVFTGILHVIVVHGY